MMCVDGFELRASAVAVAPRDRRLGRGQLRGQLALHPRIAARELACIDHGRPLQRIQCPVQRRWIERLVAQLSRVPDIDAEDAPIPHGGAADLIVAQVELVALAGDVDELRLLEPAEQLRRRQIDAGLAADRVLPAFNRAPRNTSG